MTQVLICQSIKYNTAGGPPVIIGIKTLSSLHLAKIYEANSGGHDPIILSSTQNTFSKSICNDEFFFVRSIPKFKMKENKDEKRGGRKTSLVGNSGEYGKYYKLVYIFEALLNVNCHRKYCLFV